MASPLQPPERAIIGAFLEIPRLINGLWITSGSPTDAAAAEAMGALFDRPAHYAPPPNRVDALTWG